VARFEFNGDVDLIRQLEKLENYDEIAKQILNEAAPVLIKYVSRAFTQRISAEVGRSVKKTTLDKNKYGWYVAVRPTGNTTSGHWKYSNNGITAKQLKNRKKVTLRNMDLVAYFEYGTSNMPAKPMMQSTVNDAADEISNKLQEGFNKAVNGL